MYNRSDEVGESVMVIFAAIVSLILALFSTYYWWHADDAWLTALRLSITNVVWTGSTIVASGLHWALGLVVALGVGVFFIGAW